jgi:hypothetical protein
MRVWCVFHARWGYDVCSTRDKGMMCVPQWMRVWCVFHEGCVQQSRWRWSCTFWLMNNDVDFFLGQSGRNIGTFGINSIRRTWNISQIDRYKIPHCNKEKHILLSQDVPRLYASHKEILNLRQHLHQCNTSYLLTSLPNMKDKYFATVGKGQLKVKMLRLHAMAHTGILSKNFRTFPMPSLLFHGFLHIN